MAHGDDLSYSEWRDADSGIGFDDWKYQHQLTTEIVLGPDIYTQAPGQASGFFDDLIPDWVGGIIDFGTDLIGGFQDESDDPVAVDPTPPPASGPIPELPVYDPGYDPPVSEPIALPGAEAGWDPFWGWVDDAWRNWETYFPDAGDPNPPPLDVPEAAVPTPEPVQAIAPTVFTPLTASDNAT